MGSVLSSICKTGEEEKKKLMEDSMLRREVRAEVVPKKKHLKRDDSLFLPEKSVLSGNVIKSHYNMMDQIGKGSFGHVQKAYLKVDSGKKRPFAIKTVEKSVHQKELKRFLREIEILKTLDHPNIIRFFEAYESRNSYFIIQELCEGGDLGKLLELQTVGVPENIARDLMWQILQSIHYLHFKGIAHRDIKPENFLIEKPQSRILKLIDFGLSATISCSTEVINETVGSPFFIAPEVLEKNYSPLCDIWSAGIILFNLMTCSFPFVHEENPILFEMIKKGQYNKSPIENSGYSTVAKDLLERMLIREEEPDGRKRISAFESLQHEWFQENRQEIGREGKKFLSKGLLENLRNFSYQTLIQREMMNLMVHETDFNNPEIQKIRTVFRYIDTDMSGSISAKEIDAIYKEYDIELNDGEIYDIIDSLYFKEKAVVTYLEFTTACIDKEFYRDKTRVKELFDYIDVSGRGEIDYTDIQDCFKRFGRLLDENKIRRMIEECDMDKNHMISLDEFYSIIVAERKKVK